MAVASSKLKNRSHSQPSFKALDDLAKSHEELRKCVSSPASPAGEPLALEKKPCQVRIARVGVGGRI
jgi:hypothetical protein